MFEREIRILKTFGIEAEVSFGDHLDIRSGGRLSKYVNFDWHPANKFYCSMTGTWANIDDLKEYQIGIVKGIAILEALKYSAF